MVSTVYEFGGFRLDSGRFELSRAGRSVKLERKPMELLILLAARSGDLITRTEIAERLWGNEVFVDTEHGINTAIRKVRNVLGDDSEEPRFVQTVMGKGYRFVGPIVAVQAAPAEAPATHRQSLVSAKRRRFRFRRFSGATPSAGRRTARGRSTATAQVSPEGLDRGGGPSCLAHRRCRPARPKLEKPRSET